MKAVSMRIQNKYMKAFIETANKRDGFRIDLNLSPAKTLAGRPDFLDVTSVLEGQNHLKTTRAAAGNILEVRLTSQGKCYFETQATETAEKRWTRGLAIAALITSILSLSISGLSLLLQALSLSQ